MARMGMDVDQVASAGKALKERAAEIDALVGKLDGIVRAIPGAWVGPDAQQFVNEWWPEHKKTLQAASSHVAGLGQSALNNASEQREVSGNSVGGGGDGSTGPNAPQSGFGTAGEVGGPALTSASGRYDLTRDAGYDGVRIQGVIGPDGVLRYIAYLDGTDPGRGLNQRGVLENAAQVGVSTDTYRNALERLQREIQPPGSEVMLVGYSQGGIHAQMLAASGAFRVTDVMTFGSPYAPVSDSADYHIVRIEDENDPIPKTDLRDEVITAWRSILGDDAGAIDQYLDRQSETYKTDAGDNRQSWSNPLGSHTDPETYREGGRQFEELAMNSPEGRAALESQARYGGTVVTDSMRPDANVYDRDSNTWLPKF